MRIVAKTLNLRRLLTLSFCGLLPGCTTFHPVETTPEAIVESIAPGDTVRITTWDGSVHEMLACSESINLR